MTIERYVEQVPADQTGVIQLPIERGPGNFLLFQSSLANVTITLIYDGVREVFANVNGGIYVRRIKPWTNLRIDGAIGTQCTFFVGSVDGIDTDETDIRQQVAVLAGVSATADQPATSMSETPVVVAANAALTPIVPINFLRRRVLLTVDPLFAGGIVYARRSAGVNNLVPMQAGIGYGFSGFYAISIRNDTGAPANIYVCEEN